MQQYVVYRRKKRQGPAPALTPGNRYEVLDVRGDVVLIRNDRGVNKWYYRDGFEEGGGAPSAPAKDWEKEYIACRAVLRELVTLKMVKDQEGKTPEYQERQPKAWQAAIDFLNRYDHFDETKAGEKHLFGNTEEVATEPFSTIDFDELWDEHSEYIDDQIDDLSLWAGSAVIGKTQWSQIVTEFQAEIERRNKIIEKNLKISMRLNMPGISEQEQEATWQDFKNRNNL